MLRKRALARLADAMIVGVVAVAFGAGTGFGVGWLIATAGGIYGYFVVFDLTGATPGKRLLGVRVHATGGSDTPTLRQAALRELFVLAGAIPFAGPILAAASWITIALGIRSHPDGRAWHDRLARTHVTEAIAAPVTRI
jgi:uncharacterized RDD family membrane protein YckC